MLILGQHGWGTEQATCRCVRHDLLREPSDAWVSLSSWGRVLRRLSVRCGQEQPEEGGDGHATRDHTYDDPKAMMGDGDGGQ